MLNSPPKKVAAVRLVLSFARWRESCRQMSQALRDRPPDQTAPCGVPLLHSTVIFRAFAADSGRVSLWSRRAAIATIPPSFSGFRRGSVSSRRRRPVHRKAFAESVNAHSDSLHVAGPRVDCRRSRRVEPASAQIWKHIVPASYVEEVPQGERRTDAGQRPLADHGRVVRRRRRRGTSPGTRRRAAFAPPAHGLRPRSHLRPLRRQAAPVAASTTTARRCARATSKNRRTNTPCWSATSRRSTIPRRRRRSNASRRCLRRCSKAIRPIRRWTKCDKFSTNVMSKVSGRGSAGRWAGRSSREIRCLPREYFVPKGVDDFVAKMNQGVEHSLLDCPGRYTVQVATFRGKTRAAIGRRAAQGNRRHRLDVGQEQGRIRWSKRPRMLIC